MSGCKESKSGLTTNLSKPFHMPELVARLRALVRRSSNLPYPGLMLKEIAVASERMRAKVGTLHFERAPGIAAGFVVPGNDSRISQVIDNLVENARSFSPKGGTVRVSCRRLRNEAEIVVDDDGPGIRPEALARIFERFYTDRPEGFGQNSGLGLSISRQIIEGHGGRVWAENRTVAVPRSEPRVVG